MSAPRRADEHATLLQRTGVAAASHPGRFVAALAISLGALGGVAAVTAHADAAPSAAAGLASASSASSMAAATPRSAQESPPDAAEAARATTGTSATATRESATAGESARAASPANRSAERPPSEAASSAKAQQDALSRARARIGDLQAASEGSAALQASITALLDRADTEGAEQAGRAARDAQETEQAQAEAAEAATAARAADARTPALQDPITPAPVAAPTTSRPTTGDGDTYRAYAATLVSAEDYACLDVLWTRESGWDPLAQNPTSTAFGIPQFLDTTWAGTGIAKTTDGRRQVDAGLRYIVDRYGNACAALQHSDDRGWY